MAKAANKCYGTGRRKKSIARVYLVPERAILQLIKEVLMSILD